LNDFRPFSRLAAGIRDLAAGNEDESRCSLRLGFPCLLHRASGV